MKPDEIPSAELDRKMHAMVGDIAKQIKWQINGALIKMSKDDWRHFFVAHIRPGNRMVPNIDGDGIVILGASSKSLNKSEKCAMVDLMYAFGSQRNVKWTDPNEQSFMQTYENL